MSTDNNPLPEAIRKRIEIKAKSLEWNTGNVYDAAFLAGVSEARHSLKLIEALKKIGKQTTDRGPLDWLDVWAFAHNSINEYNQTL